MEKKERALQGKITFFFKRSSAREEEVNVEDAAKAASASSSCADRGSMQSVKVRQSQSRLDLGI